MTSSLTSGESRDPRVAVVTGGASGLGRACAHRLALRGFRVAIVDIDAASPHTAAKSLPNDAIGILADVTIPDDVESAVHYVEETLGTPTAVINAAGILRPTRVLDISFDEWNAVIGVSLTGTFLVSQTCARLMTRARYGRIINFSSTAGKSVSTLGGAHYTAAKAGVLGLTRALAKELSPVGITVNALCPGLFDTPMVRSYSSTEQLARLAGEFPIDRLGQPDEVAAVVEFLCSDDAAYITGAAIDINGGDLMV